MSNSTQLRTKMMQLGAIASLLVVLPLFQNCSGVGFTATSDSSNSQDGGGGGNSTSGNLTQNSCNNNQLQTITTPVKIVLIVDTSGSNAGSNGTDPGKTYRAGSIQTFFNDYGGKSNFNWGFMTFQGTTSSAILNNGGNTQSPAFTNSASLMQTAITYFENNVPDQNNTPYLAAITMASSLIQNDTAVTADTKYIVVFLSDGLPTDASDTAIFNAVSSLVNIKPNQITFNTVFYGPTDPSASTRLNDMATMYGHGQFLDTNSNPSAKDFLINNVVTVPGSNCTTP